LPRRLNYCRLVGEGAGVFNMRICRLFSLPVFTNLEQMERARVLSFIVWSVLIVNCQIFVFCFLLPQHWARWLAVFVTLSVTLPFMLVLNHYGRTSLAVCAVGPVL
jgi:hypothetical protein